MNGNIRGQSNHCYMILMWVSVYTHIHTNIHFFFTKNISNSFYPTDSVTILLLIIYKV